MEVCIHSDDDDEEHSRLLFPDFEQCVISSTASFGVVQIITTAVLRELIS